MIDRAAFLSKLDRDLDMEEVAWNGDTLHVRAMTAGERDRFDLAHAKDPGKDFRARLVVHTLCDEDGQLLLKPDDLGQLSDLPSYAIEPLVEAAIRINRMSSKDVEELRKNSSGQSDDSSSGSPSLSAEPLDSSSTKSRALS